MSSYKNSDHNWESIDFKVTKKEGEYETLKAQKKTLSKKEKEATKDFTKIVKALAIAQEVARLTQKELEVQISSIVTAAIQAIFEKPYEFVVDFQVRRNKTEADIYLVDEEGNRFNPLNDNGGGIADVIAFSLRLACWRIQNPRTSKTIIFDEPLKFVSEKYLPNVVEFIKEISIKLGLQIIMVTHVSEFVNRADNVIEIT